jgi:hypothetical protein
MNAELARRRCTAVHLAALADNNDTLRGGNRWQLLETWAKSVVELMIEQENVVRPLFVRIML